MKSFEIIPWSAGVTLLVLFVGVQTWGETERQRDIAAFVQAQQQLAPLGDAPPPDLGAHLMVRLIDIVVPSLRRRWSPEWNFARQYALLIAFGDLR